MFVSLLLKAYAFRQMCVLEKRVLDTELLHSNLINILNFINLDQDLYDNLSLSVCLLNAANQHAKPLWAAPPLSPLLLIIFPTCACGY